MNISEIKHDRLSEAERFLLEIIDGLIEYNSIDYPDSIFYKKDNVVMFEYDSKSQKLYYSYYDIRVVFCDEFDLNVQDTNKLVQFMVETNLNLMVKTTYPTNVLKSDAVETNLKLRVKTTEPLIFEWSDNVINNLILTVKIS